MSFNAEGLVIDSKDKERKLKIESPQDIVGFCDNVEEVQVGPTLRVYYGVNSSGVGAVLTTGDEKHYMSYPILFVECNATAPIKITDKAVEELKSKVDFF